MKKVFGAGNRGRATLGRLLFAVGTCCVLLALAVVVRGVRARAARMDQAREVAGRMEAVMPATDASGANAAAAAGDGQAMPMWASGEASYVGVLAASGTASRLPVCATYDDVAAGGVGPYVFRGTPRDCLVLMDPSADGYLADFWHLGEGQEVTFADVGGACVTYSVKAHVNQAALDLGDANLAGSKLILCSYNGWTRCYQLVCCVLVE